MKLANKFVAFASVLALALGFVPFITPAKATAAFNPNYTILDATFENTGSMTAAQIDAKINSYYPSSCISTLGGFGTPDPRGFISGSYQFGANVSAGQAIYDIAQIYHVNPQVIMATMQKEQSVITGAKGCHYDRPNASDASQVYTCTINDVSTSCTDACPFSYGGGCMNIAMSYNCPGSCKVSSEGFEKQLSAGTWVLRFSEQRAYGNLTGYAGYDSGDETLQYNGPLTPGNRQRYAGGPIVSSDGTWVSSDGVSLNITNGATASLYTYTPFANDTNFFTIYNSWFGSPVSPCYNSVNVPGAITGEHVIPNKLGINHTDNLTLIVPNNTSTTCIEGHTWVNTNYNIWLQHFATISPTIDPTQSKIISADTNGDGIDELYQVDYNGHSGMIEIHGWDSTYQRWSSHIATNRPGVSSADDEVIAADLNGDGKDEFYLIEYQHTSTGMVQIHGWTPNFQQWTSHIVTNYGVFDPKTAQVIAADLDGDGKDELYLVNYTNTASGRIEVHGWTPNFQQWFSHVATVAGGGPHVDGSGNPVTDIISADLNGDGKDELYLIQYTGTGSARLEIHGMTPNLLQWSSHNATNSGSF